MKRSPFILYVISCLISGLIFVLLKFAIPETSFAYSFMFLGWQIQFLSTWLFFVGLLYWFQRYIFFKKEEEAFEKVNVSGKSISHDQALKLMETIPEQYKHTVMLKRFRDLLQAFLYGEDLIRLNEELSQRDATEVERGHLILDSLRNIIPVVGFLGTVIGLSMGMINFPEVTKMEVLRTALRSFAASLSVAFNTTLLALAYTIAIILLTSFLRLREETLVSKVDERARVLIGLIKFETHPSKTGIGTEPLVQVLDNWKEEFLKIMKDLLKKNSS